MMLILCSECGHRLRAGMGSVGAFGIVEFFDDRAQSDTQGKQVMHCPGCGLWFYYGFGIELSDAAQPG